MAKFSPKRVHFGHGADDDGEGLPTPAKVKLALRRQAGIREAKEVLKHLPGPGESLHAIVTARMDLTDVIACLGDTFGPAALRIATLGYNARNLRAMLAWLDAGVVTDLTLLASIFFRSHNGELWEETLEAFRARSKRAACCHSHAKVVTLAFTGGTRLSIEGSANLCGNGSGREQFALINDPGLHDWHAAWINDLVTKHEGDARDCKEKG